MVLLLENLRIPLKLILGRAVKYCKLAVVFSVLASAGILMGQKGLIEKHALEEKRIVLQKDNERLAVEIKDLERNVTLLRTDPRTIEQVAKRELGMARPDEMVYVFDGNQPWAGPVRKRESGLRRIGNLP
jgi:cell division protein FtsB